nr:periplasmic heavy metal sensor [uncultured Hyphomonas sp.]
MSDMSDTPRRWPFWLIVSLMVNMILVGLLVGFLLQASPRVPPDGPPPERISWGSRDDGTREAMRRVFREAFKASAEERAARATVRKHLAEAVSADPYNPDAVRDAFRELRAADDAVNEATHEAMVTLFATMSLEERQHMARILMRGPGDRRSSHNKRGPDGRNGPAGDGPPPPPNIER